MAEHVLDGATYYHVWDSSLTPILSMKSGDIVHVELPMGGDPKLHPKSTTADLDFDAFVYNLVGPIYIDRAQAGDAIEIEVLALTVGDWGWTVIAPGLGLLPDEFPDPFLKIWDLTPHTHTALTSEIQVPLSPSLGVIGVHPGGPQILEPFAPHRGGGNLDNRSIGVGSRVWLPVWHEGALLSSGDGHAAQGDGEVCISAIECAMSASLRVHLRRGMRLATPRFATSQRASAHVPDIGGHYGTMGIHSDLHEGTRAAVRAMIYWLVEEHELSKEDAYVLCSVVGCLRILEIVNMGVWNVGFTIPRTVLEPQ